MNNTQKRILQEANRIGQSLLQKSKKDSKGVYWHSLSMNTAREHVWEVSESIYGGCAGIALFLLELYKHTGNKLYYETTEQAMARLELICKEKEADSEAFFTGRIGVSYVFLKLYDLSKDKKYLQAASDIARSGVNAANESHPIDDLINGASGVLLALLHLHSYTGEKWIEDDVRKIAHHLVNRASTAQRGLYWDKTIQQIHGLCGFSHGAAGVGFVFLELGKYFDDPSCYELARLAFDYEKTYFVPKLNNWQDLRKSFFDAEDLIEAKEQFISGKLTPLIKGSDMNAWCHGAAGIGLSRIEASKLLHEKQYDAHLKSALKKTRFTDMDNPTPHPSYTLCHGTGGNMDLFIEAAAFLGDQKYLKQAEKLALKAIDSHQKYGFYMSGFGTGGEKEDISLFMGAAGVGYFMLRVLDPVKTPSILAPVIEKKQKTSGKSVFKEEELKLTLLKKDYPTTIALLEKFQTQALKRAVQSANFLKLPADFEKGLKEYFKTSENDKSVKLIKDRLQLESKKLKLQRAINSYALLYVKYVVLNEKMAELEKQLAKLDLKLNDGIELVKSRFVHLEGTESLSDIKPQTAMVMLKTTHNGIAQDELSDFSYWVLSEFGEKKSFSSALKELITAFGATTKEEQAQVEQAYTEQVRHALRSQVLVAVD